ncbi:sulfatase family protein [Alicyclobacillus fastidiosus]|uniref:Sulfatase n=1 Tax=Alicyclobacillus fastidiosus TaxID=392011 RepID=A0ABV5A8S0_9BACL|nr:sulfatase [Alicyclobacillus fastidiosus]WEH10638.1 sulfatase [Alicyclobacillus fastidiosus]
MNILLIHTHDTGRFIEPYGYQVPTPNLMEFARRATLFRQVFSAAPTCSPSRTALLTGVSPHVNGMLGLAHRGFAMHDYSQHLVHFLNRHGYETVLCGVQHESTDVQALGYKKVLGYYEPGAAATAADDLSHAEEVANYLHGAVHEPFFLSYGLLNTHREFPGDRAANPNYVMPPFPLPDLPETRQDMAEFIGSAQMADECIGRVLTALRESGKDENTLVIFTTDHGIAFPMMKCNLLDTGIGVSLIMDYPNNPRRGHAVDTLVSQVDLFPTICDICGLEQPEWLEGASLVPVLAGELEEVRDELFAEVTFHASYEPMRCVRTKRYKLIRYYDDDTGYVPANIDDSKSKDVLLQNGLLTQLREREMLFDLYLDPAERVNCAHRAAYQEVYNDLAERLDRWMRATADPILNGPVLKPATALVNKRTCISPQLDDFE